MANKPAFAQGAQVEHGKYGLGSVMSCNEDHIVIKFDDHGVKIFAVRDDLTAIGRVADSRFGISACDQEAKYPLGLWRQGETRSFDYTCWHGDSPRAQVASLTIHEIDFDYGGREHCLKIEWLLRAKDDARAVDHRIYIFAPGRGVVRQWQVP